jgi:hypothetical protein
LIKIGPVKKQQMRIEAPRCKQRGASPQGILSVLIRLHSGCTQQGMRLLSCFNNQDNIFAVTNKCTNPHKPQCLARQIKRES